MGHEICAAGTLEQAAKAVTQRGIDVLLVQTDDFQSGVRERLADGYTFRREPPVIALAGESSIEDAVRAMRAGAANYLSAKPLDACALRAALARVLDCAAGDPFSENDPLNGAKSPFEGFITSDYRMIVVCNLIASVADSKATLLIQGESGTGKTLLARLLHENSARRFGRFVEVNCGTLTDTLLASELFGHVRGAFTSAYREHAGKFEIADGGSILIDEIASASLSLQARLLRVVESGEFQRVGDTRTLRTDVRIVAATKASLEERAAQGLFRRDLYHRLSTLKVELIPLRERVEDIALLARHFLRVLAARHNPGVRNLSPGAMDRLVHYPWPGNVHELRNAVAHAVILAGDGVVEAEHLPENVAKHQWPVGRDGKPLELCSLRDALRKPERSCILHALRTSRWNKQHAARELGISRSTLYKKMKEHGLIQAGPGSRSMLSRVAGVG